MLIGVLSSPPGGNVMVSTRIRELLGAALGLLFFSTGTAFASLAPTATISATPHGANYDYTILLKNTGTTNIGTFWFAWTPPDLPDEFDFLPSEPLSVSQPPGWV